MVVIRICISYAMLVEEPIPAIVPSPILKASIKNKDNGNSDSEQVFL